MNDRKDINEHLEPQERLKQLIHYINLVKVDPNVPPTRYYRSGLEMIRMANVYLEEGSLENAYILYLKFMTLFLERIRKHPDFNTVPSDVKAINQLKLREVFPKAENLKKRLLQQYQDDYDRYIAELKQYERVENERKKRESMAKKQSSSKNPTSYSPAIVAKMPGNIEDVRYPDPYGPSAPAGTPVDSGSMKSDPPSVDRTKKPSDIMEERFNSNILRTVIVPTKVMVSFQSMAQANTMNNIETCGILAGKLEKNELIITHMILPKQKGTADSCMTMQEEELFDYQDQHNLITIGWIHTHPTQTAFLSSVDLHTHCPYQLLMPEAVAIVCAPRYNETGFFILTPNHGLQYIANCRKTGFHPHPTEPPLFKNADHIRIENSAPLEVLDLRTK